MSKPDNSRQEDPKAALTDLADSVSRYLDHARFEGVASLETSPDVVKELGTLPPLRKTATSSSQLDSIARAIAGCTKCPLHKTRTKVVPGQGSSSPEVMFIGEAPGSDEDQQGLAFVGRAGQLLTKMIEAMGFKREDVFIANILKCRPPDNRVPLPEEMAVCVPYLKAQIAVVKPKVLVLLGATATKALLNAELGITKLRGTWMTYEGIDTMPTFHPSYLLRCASEKPKAWEDLKAVLTRIGREPPAWTKK